MRRPGWRGGQSPHRPWRAGAFRLAGAGDHRFSPAERAARCAGSEPLTGTALNGLSDVLIRRGEIDAALTAAHESIRVHEHLKDNGGQAEAWKNVANAEWAHSAINSSVAIHRALDLWIAAGNSQGEAIALNNIGNLHKAAGELDATLEYHTRALRILEDIGDWRRAAVVTNNMGINYFNRGEYATALGYNQRALALHRVAGNQYGVGTSLDSSGNI